MGWKIELSRRAEKELAHIDKSEAHRIIEYLSEVEALENPRFRGRGLVSNLSGLWRYRVGAWRILCHIEDDRLLVLVVQIGHRSIVYDT